MDPKDYNIDAVNIKVDKTLGYLYFQDRNHPLANKSGKVYLHRHIASVNLKRWISKDEVVHHKDKERTNNSKENIEITDKSKHATIHAEERNPDCNKTKPCEVCKKETKNKRFCSHECASEGSIKIDIDKDVLEFLVWRLSRLKLSKILGISDTAIVKKCKKHGIKYPGRGYWEKVYHNAPVG